MQPKSFLFGLITIKEWGMNWVYSNAAIELMSIDKPLTFYNSKDKSKTPSKAKIERAIEEYRNHTEEDLKFNINDWRGI